MQTVDRVRVRRCCIAPMDRLEVVSIISSDLIPLPPSDEAEVSQYQRDRYHQNLLHTIRWLCAKELPDADYCEMWAMVNLAEAAEIARKHFPKLPQRAAQALAFAWERGGDRVEMNPSSRERILAVLEAVS